MDAKFLNKDIFFTRPHSKTFFDEYMPKMSRHLNLYNVFSTNKQILANYFSIKERQDFLAYRFYLLKRWISKNEKYTPEYVKKLDLLINKLHLWNELNSFERQWILDVNDIVFAKTRNLKSLIVDFETNRKEIVVFKYDNIQFSFASKKNKEKVISYCTMYISNQRLVIIKGVENFNLNWKQIKSYHFSTQKICITTNTDSKFYLSSNNNYVLHTSFCRIFEIIKK